MNVKIDEITGERRVNQIDTPDNSVDLSRLHSMTKEELIALVMRFAGQCGAVASMSEEETAQALFDVLAAKGLKGDIQAAREWFDRKRGKPAQTVAQTVNLNVRRDETLGGLRKLPPERIKEALELLEMPVIEN